MCFFFFFLLFLSSGWPSQDPTAGGKGEERDQEEITEGFLEGVQNGDGDKVSKSLKVRLSE